MHRAVGGRVLHQRAHELLRAQIHRAVVAHHHLHAQRLGAGAHHLHRLRVAAVGDEEGRAGLLALLVHGQGQSHCLGGGGAFIQQRGVGHLQTRQVHDQRLEVEQRLQPALRNLRLIGRVLGVPARVLEDVAEDDVRRVRVVVAHADEGPEHLVLRGDGLQGRQQFVLAARGRELQRLLGADGGRDGLVDESIERVHAQRGQQLLQLGVIRTIVTAGKRLLILPVQGHGFVARRRVVRREVEDRP